MYSNTANHLTPVTQNVYIVQYVKTKTNQKIGNVYTSITFRVGLMLVG
jgi:hypothetical protein